MVLPAPDGPDEGDDPAGPDPGVEAADGAQVARPGAATLTPSSTSVVRRRSGAGTVAGRRDRPLEDGEGLLGGGHAVGGGVELGADLAERACRSPGRA